MCVKRDAGESVTLLSGKNLLITCFMHKQNKFTHLCSTHVIEASFRGCPEIFFFNNSLLLSVYSTSLYLKLSECCSEPQLKVHRALWELPARYIYVSDRFLHRRTSTFRIKRKKHIFVRLYETFLFACMIRV